MRTRIMNRGLICALLALTVGVIGNATAHANSSYSPIGRFEPVYHPSLTIARTNATIDVDGDLSDRGWKDASRSDLFVERSPGDMTEPAVRTEVMVAYDDKHLYVAFKCYDDPASIRATMCQRDQFSGDDAVVVLLDTYGDASWAYEFFVNPYGIQRDMLWTTTVGEDSGYDMIWKSAAKITDFGYQVEIAIPFSGMRFPSRDMQEWKMDFWRNRPRESQYQYSWAAYDRNEQCWPCQWGTVSGIANVEPGKGLELLSAMVANQTGKVTDPEQPGTSFENSDVDGSMSFGAKYALSSDMTVEGTFNPDFSQIEADAAQIDVNTTINLIYPERRPFFQEGADIFRTLFNSFYTRTIWNPQYVTKLTGRSGGGSIGFLSAMDEQSPYTIPLEEGGIVLDVGKSYVNVLRGSLSFGGNSRGGFMLTDRRFEGGGYGTILSADAEFRLSHNYSWIGQFVSSYTKEPENSVADRYAGLTFDHGKHDAALNGESFSGTAFITQFRRNGRHLNVRLNMDQVAPSYRTQTGYDPWNNYRNGFAVVSYTFYGDGGLIERFTPNVYWDRRWNFDGDIKWTHYNASLNANLSVWQMYTSLEYQEGSEKWSGMEFDGLRSVNLTVGGRPSAAVGFEVSGNVGRGVALWVPSIGNEISTRAALNFKPIDRLIVEPSVSYARSTDVSTDVELFEQFITRTRLRYQMNRELSVRLVVQYNDRRETWDIDPLVTYLLSPFSVFYIGSTYDYENMTAGPGEPNNWHLSERKFFMKLQYLFQT